jgi:hypothetical protein
MMNVIRYPYELTLAAWLRGKRLVMMQIIILISIIILIMTVVVVSIGSSST